MRRARGLLWKTFWRPGSRAAFPVRDAAAGALKRRKLEAADGRFLLLSVLNGNCLWIFPSAQRFFGE